MIDRIGGYLSFIPNVTISAAARVSALSSQCHWFVRVKFARFLAKPQVPQVRNESLSKGFAIVFGPRTLVRT
jgi:hypothetical protein